MTKFEPFEVDEKDIEKLKKRSSYQRFYYTDKEGKSSLGVAALGRYILQQLDLLKVTNQTRVTLYEYHKDTGIWLQQSNDYTKSIAHKWIVKIENADGVRLWKAKTERDLSQYINNGIERKTYRKTFGKKPKLIFNFKNGVYDWKTNQIRPPQKSDYLTYQSSFNYVPSADKPHATDYAFAHWFGENAQTMKEFIGYCFYPSYEPIQELVILKGNGGDGKTSFSNYLTNLLGADICSAVGLNDLASGKDKNFSFSELLGKFLNTCSELSDSSKHFIDTAALKKLTGNDLINAPVKNSPDAKFINYAKFLILTNELVSFRDSSKGWQRRINIINFHSLPVSEWENIKASLEKERELFISECIKLATKAIDKREFTRTKTINQNVNSWMLENDPIKQFLNERCILNRNTKIEKSELYESYVDWCVKNGAHCLSKNKFTRKVKEKGFIVNRTTVDAQTVSYYVGIDLKDAADYKFTFNRPLTNAN